MNSTTLNDALLELIKEIKKGTISIKEVGDYFEEMMKRFIDIYKETMMPVLRWGLECALLYAMLKEEGIANEAK